MESQKQTTDPQEDEKNGNVLGEVFGNTFGDAKGSTKDKDEKPTPPTKED